MGAKALKLASILAEEDRQLGFKGTRTFTHGCEECYLGSASPSGLLHYEKDLGKAFSLPFSAFCTYDARRLVDLGLQNLIINLYQFHGQIIGKGLACPNE